jgi:hypothetical protein
MLTSLQEFRVLAGIADASSASEYTAPLDEEASLVESLLRSWEPENHNVSRTPAPAPARTRSRKKKRKDTPPRTRKALLKENKQLRRRCSQLEESLDQATSQIHGLNARLRALRSPVPSEMRFESWERPQARPRPERRPPPPASRPTPRRPVNNPEPGLPGMGDLLQNGLAPVPIHNSGPTPSSLSSAPEPRWAHMDYDSGPTPEPRDLSPNPRFTDLATESAPLPTTPAEPPLDPRFADPDF